MGMCSICYIKIVKGTIKLPQFMKLIYEINLPFAHVSSAKPSLLR